jgi:hypothetical protein
VTPTKRCRYLLHGSNRWSISCHCDFKNGPHTWACSRSLHIYGLVPLTTNDLQAAMGNLQGRFEHIIKETHASLIQQFTSSSNLLTQGQHRRANGQQPSGHFNWGDGLIHHAVPIGWSFPNRITPKALWDLWYFGNQAENIGPYRYISVEHDLPIKKDKCQYSRAKKVMEY